MDRTYKNLVFSKHALERLSGRSLTQAAIHQTISDPERTFQNQGNTKFIRTLNGRRIHVVATPIEQRRWLIVSAWVRGEEDREPVVWQIIALPFRLLWKLLSLPFAKRKKRSI